MSTPMQDLFHKEMFDQEIHALGELLNMEIIEVEVYNKALQKIRDLEFMPTLEACRNAHAHRVEVLRQRILKQGGTPNKGSGFIGGVAKFIEQLASMISDQAVISILSASEELCMQEYEKYLKNLDSESWSIAESDLLPGQEKTHDTLKKLNTFLRSDQSDQQEGKYHLNL